MKPQFVTHQGVAAEEVLYVLNKQQTVHLGGMSLCVITGIYTPHRLEPQNWPFTPGEILVLDYTQDGYKEFLGAGRDIHEGWEDSNWVTHCADSLEDCLALADKVRSDSPRGYYVYTDDGWSFAADQAEAHRVWCGAPNESVARVGDFAGRGAMAERQERNPQASP